MPKTFEVVMKDEYTGESERQSVIIGDNDSKIYISLDVTISDRYEIFIMPAGKVPRVAKKRTSGV
jgi:hypothetical protein